MIQWPETWTETAPEAWRAPELDAEGVEAFFYEGAPYRGRPTRVFAYVGMPRTAPGETAPAMVLVPGGGASALAKWVRLWNDKGYAAVCMDVCGCTPGANPVWPEWPHPRHPHGGPAGWGFVNSSPGDPPEDQWAYHAAAAVLRARGLLRAQPAVDAGRIGITGVSWGSVTLLWAAVSADWPCAIPVYGCGFLGDSPLMREKSRTPEGRRWIDLWDPGAFLPRARVRNWLWISGPGDQAFGLDARRRSYRVAPGARWLSLKPGMIHAHGGPGEDQPEIFAFADACLRGGRPMPRLGDPFTADGRAWAGWGLSGEVRSAELAWSPERETDDERNWFRAPAEIDGTAASAALPDSARMWYFHVRDAAGLEASSPHGSRT